MDNLLLIVKFSFINARLRTSSLLKPFLKLSYLTTRALDLSLHSAIVSVLDPANYT